MLWKIYLAEEYGTGEMVECLHECNTLAEVFDQIGKLKPEEYAKQTGNRRIVWSSIGEETEEHRKQRNAVNF